MSSPRRRRPPRPPARGSPRIDIPRIPSVDLPDIKPLPTSGKRKVYPEIRCPKCGHVWLPRKPYPKQCPYCKRYLVYY